MSDFVSIWTEAGPRPPFEPTVTADPARIVEEIEERILEDAPTEELPPLEVVPEEEEPIDIDALLAEARAEALEQARAELEPERERLAQEIERTAVLGREVAALRGRVLDGLSGDISAIVLAVTRRVVGDALAMHPDALKRVLDGAVGRFPERSGLTVRVSPEDVERVSAWLGDALIVPDPEVSGGCIVGGDEGVVDASLDAVFEGLDAAVAAWQQERQ